MTAKREIACKEYNTEETKQTLDGSRDSTLKGTRYILLIFARA